MKSKFKVEGILGLDDPRTTSLVEDVGRIANQLMEYKSPETYRAILKSDRNQDLKSLRLKIRLLSNLLTNSVRLRLELLIVDCE
jgi:hypothetical protein